jgi:hypothetical protein
MINHIGAYATLITAGAMQIISGAFYFWYTNFYMKKEKNNE